ncbi:Methyltransferase domain-containing protein [Natronoarchaeum philippinense]|uniref:Methyltransferase domain-containing protein n=1 Tax=Natronoarchaeum philippinense TaxID=558529 RepID=A0A285N563_NATPI|nr:class I SAM-dependent methyltransferase [Natronoarchaeum philippinense]SNZ03136.1 Methyltransferase domain-containing protein [Natronoarchaeum philippinense]
MDVPTTVRTALEDQPVAGATCLEAGAGLGNATAGLLDAGAERVYAVTDDAEHARTTRRRVAAAASDRNVVLEADLRALPLAANSIDVITAHGLCNVLAPPALDAVAAELTRVAAPGCRLIVDDYEPLPADAPVTELFSLENAVAEQTDGVPALTFYPSDVLVALFEQYGWVSCRETTLLDPVPWTRSHLDAHAEAVRARAEKLPDATRDRVVSEAEQLVAAISATECGRMYSVALCRPG